MGCITYQNEGASSPQTRPNIPLGWNKDAKHIDGASCSFDSSPKICP
jgi:hypothetical protein